MYAGCVSAAIQKEDYLAQISQSGFQAVTIQKQKAIYIPDDILSDYPDSRRSPHSDRGSNRGF